MISASRRRDIDRQKAPLASLLEKQATSIFLLAALPSYMLTELTERAVELNTFSRGSKKPACSAPGTPAASGTSCFGGAADTLQQPDMG